MQVGHDSSIGLADAGNGMAVMKLKTNLLPFLSVVWLAPSKLLAAGHDCVPVVFYVDSAGKRMRCTGTLPYDNLVRSDFHGMTAASV
jgi:actin related protein 2/3 complex subunit 1A/1B